MNIEDDLNKVKFTIVIPHFVLTVLTARNNTIITWAPVYFQDETLMSFPLKLLLLVGTYWL